METLKFDKEITALLVIDPCNDFISEGGKLWELQRRHRDDKRFDCFPMTGQSERYQSVIRRFI
jgi:hypothetical protein